MFDLLKKSLSCEGDTSNMRLLTTICVLFAIFVGIVSLSMWIYCNIVGKDIKELGLVIGLCGTFLAVLIPKAIQSFPENNGK